MVSSWPVECDIINIAEWLQSRSNCVNRYTLTMSFMLCCHPHSQLADLTRSKSVHLSTFTCLEDNMWHGPWGRSNVGSVTIVCMTTEADNQSSLHCAVMSWLHCRCKPAMWAVRNRGTHDNLDGLQCCEASYWLRICGVCVTAAADFLLLLPPLNRFSGNRCHTTMQPLAVKCAQVRKELRHYTNIDWCRGQHWKILPEVV